MHKESYSIGIFALDEGSYDSEGGDAEVFEGFALDISVEEGIEEKGNVCFKEKLFRLVM